MGRKVNNSKKNSKPRGSAALNEQSGGPFKTVQTGPLNTGRSGGRPSERDPFELKPSEVLGKKPLNQKQRPLPGFGEPLKKKEPSERKNAYGGKLPQRELPSGKLMGSAKPAKPPVGAAKTGKPGTFRRPYKPARRGNILRRILGGIAGLLIMLVTLPIWGRLISFLRRGRAGRTVVLAFAAIIFVGLLSAVIYFLTRNNAFSVTVDNQQVAVIRMGSEDISEELRKQAVLRIESRIGTRVLINEPIEFVPLRAGSSELQTVDEAIIRISEALTYRVEAVAISVMGTRMTTVRSRDEAEQIFNHIKEPHLGPGLEPGVNIVEAGFLEDVTLEVVYTDEESLDDFDMAVNILTRPMELAQDYIVVPGDSLGMIAFRAGMTLNELARINPNIDVGRPIQPGDRINLMVERPLLSVRTVEERRFTTEIEPPVEHIYNPQVRSPNRRTLQFGTLGSADVVVHVIRINSMETEQVEVERIITLLPQAEIIEIGTG